MHIPLIDISPLYQETETANKFSVAQAIDKACQESGFFYVTGHPISQQRIIEMRQLAEQFFSLPAEQKQKISIKFSNNHRGYGETAAEQLDPNQPTDWKESFDMGLNLAPDHALVGKDRPLYGPNQYPESIADFQEKMERHYWDMLALGKKILSAIALALDIDETFFDDKFDHPLSVLRFLHYPPRVKQENNAQPIGAGAHTDYGCITILWQDELGGLQVQDVNGQWVDAPPIADSFVINIGNMMARWSNDRYKSTPHRVYSPSGKERYSMPFFVEPDFDTNISCLPNCKPENEEPKYQPISAGDWMIYCFNATYAYRNDAEKS
ncbi:isopenicillin N synthase family dioxygenase [Reinekea thalattae]|uniref:2-oxoglutarate-dependent ethylene/succinate-forming enzyme n=1 Tax=Reinekea thalattae TaxID=2593301 RepID=A0A5C8Z3X2_9GAMM|nr:2-oxoglutarate and iron-dependent oxygenase domain-containing protein [Reinekea thalattae]TXR51959.1 2OG-Fe(II) oxygenase [Reinekea thalattae]